MKPQMSPHQLNVAIAGAIEEIEAHYSCGHAMNESAKEYANAVRHLNARVQRLTKALRDAREAMLGWQTYVSPYFLDKHDANGDIAAIDAALAEVNEQKEG